MMRRFPVSRFAAGLALALPALAAHAGDFMVGYGLQSGARANIALTTKMLNALNAINTTVTTSLPDMMLGTVNGSGNYRSIDLKLPVFVVSGLSTPNTNTTYQPDIIGLTGSITLEARNDDFTTSGGQLTISNLSLDQDARVINGTIQGYGVESPWQGALFNYEAASPLEVTLSGCLPTTPSSCKATASSPDLRITTLTGLGLEVMSERLALTELGYLALKSASAVPEVQSHVGMLIGLAGMAAVLRRKRTAQRQAE